MSTSQVTYWPPIVEDEFEFDSMAAMTELDYSKIPVGTFAHINDVDKYIMYTGTAGRYEQNWNMLCPPSVIEHSLKTNQRFEIELPQTPLVCTAEERKLLDDLAVIAKHYNGDKGTRKALDDILEGEFKLSETYCAPVGENITIFQNEVRDYCKEHNVGFVEAVAQMLENK